MAFNLAKYKSEWAVFSDVFKHPPPATHFGGSLANRFVEACRASPYLAGHLLLLVIILLGVALWV